MIVNSLKDGWEIIYQRAHANLAAMILSGWKKSEEIFRPTETIIAVAQHGQFIANDGKRTLRGFVFCIYCEAN